MKKSELKYLIRETILKELFDTAEKVKWRSGGFDDPDYTSIFTAPNGRKYKIYMEPLMYLDLPNSVIQTAGELMSEEVFDIFFDQGYHVEFGDTEEGKGITGLGGTDTSKIFGIVINAIANKIKKENIDYFFFSAKEPSRQNLYKTLAPMIASKLGYHQANNGTYYFFSKEPLK